MWNAPSKETMSLWPSLYSTEHIPLQEKIIHAHFFIGSYDFFLAECDEEGEICFGFFSMGDISTAEWGYVSMSELKAINIGGIEVDNDIYWTPCPANEVRSICIANFWPISQPNQYMANMTA